MKDVSCVGHLSFGQPITNVPAVSQDLPVWARLHQFWETWEALGAGPKVIKILKEGYTLPFQTWNPLWNSYLIEALHALMKKNGVELVNNQKTLGFFSRLFVVPKPNNQFRPQQLKPTPQGREIQNGDTGNNKDFPPGWGVGNIHRFQGRLLPH